MSLAFAIRNLRLEHPYSVLRWNAANTARYYGTAQAVRKRPAMALVRKPIKRKEDGPSPLSPLKHAIEDKLKQRTQTFTANNGKPKGEEKKHQGSNKEGKKKKERWSNSSAKVKATPSKGVKGVISPRQLLVVPPVRPSKIPIWSRPASANLKNRERAKAPGGVSWREHRANIKLLYPERWSPGKKVSHEAMDAMRELYKLDPDKYPSWVLAQRFKISPEAARRILKSKWRPSEEDKAVKVTKERKSRAERMRRTREDEVHQMVRAGIKLKVHPDDQFDLR